MIGGGDVMLLASRGGETNEDPVLRCGETIRIPETSIDAAPLGGEQILVPSASS